MIDLKAVGTDLSEKMILGAKRNLDHVGAHAKLAAADVGEIKESVGGVGGIGTDPPYGKSTSTKGESIPALYDRAFKAFPEVLERGSHLAMVVPRVSLLESAEEFELVETHHL